MSIGYVFAGMVSALVCATLCVVMGGSPVAAFAVYVISGHIMVLGLVAVSAAELRNHARI